MTLSILHLRTVRRYDGGEPSHGGSSSVAERQLPKLNVAGSIPVSRSRNSSSRTLLIPDNRLPIRNAGVHVCPPGPSSRYKRFRALDQKGSLRDWLLVFRVISAAFQLSAPEGNSRNPRSEKVSRKNLVLRYN
jgi:hypothetical protein